MNEHFMKLAEQCTETWTSYFDGRGNVTTTTFDKEKFAELIVRECIDVVNVGGEFVSRPKMVERLKHHFGIDK